MPIIRLSREYTCIEGVPIIRSVDSSIFSMRYFMRCLACSFCKDQCCDHGVDVDFANGERLVALGPEFKARITVPPTLWFREEVVADKEFPSGANVRTQVHEGKCAFADRRGRGCAIHAYALESALDYHGLKPVVCALFPITFEDGVLVPSEEGNDGTLTCVGGGSSLYEGARSELTHYFGPELVCELESLSTALHGLDPRGQLAAKAVLAPGDEDRSGGHKRSAK